MAADSEAPGTRWALVTAGAQGLGAAIAGHLIDGGWSVLVHHRASHEGARALVERAASSGGVAHALAGDLRAAPGRVGLMAAVEAHVGVHGLDLLVNNLGVYPEERLLETSIDRWEEVFALTCTATFHLTQLALPHLRRAALARGSARVVNLGDSACDRITARQLATPYHVAKLGVHVLTRTYAQALGPDGIRVNLISPGFLENSVGTPGLAFPLGAPGRFSDILAALDFLLSDRAGYVSGANLLVAGAWNV